MFQNLYNKLLPPACSLCDLPATTGLDLCAACFETLPHNHMSCATCALPLQHIQAATQAPGEHQQAHPLPFDYRKHHVRCGKCLSTTPLLSAAIIPYLYQPPVDFMVKRLKFSADMKFSRIMGELLANAVSSQGGKYPDALIPVPQHRDRLLERGYNQALQIADIVGRRLKLPVDQHSANRLLYQPPQARLNARQREANIRRAFSVNGTVAGRRLAIVDDVYTTGATTNALARTLLKAGAEDVRVWAFARTP